MVYVLGCPQVSSLSQKQYKFYVDGIMALDDKYQKIIIENGAYLIWLCYHKKVGRKFIVYT